ncbi:MAG: DNA repair protein RecN [Chloroflexi bacterium]|nr:DNA repair protein RecN [Chloroflexota bacterium]
MLTDLHISDFAIIDDLGLEFGPGFIVLTGETGAGKSILIDAVELLLGGRADSSMVRAGATAAVIEGVFRLDGSMGGEVRALLEGEGLLEDPTFLTLGREVRSEGRSVCRVNGRTVSLGLLRQIGEYLVDVHGQSEHLSLLRVREHQALLDRHARNESLRQAYAGVYRALSDVRAELETLRVSEAEAARRADMLAFQINEIEAAAPRPGEEAGLAEDRTRLANAEQLARLAEQSLSALDETPDDRPSAIDLLGEAAEALAALSRVDPSLAGLQAEAQALEEQAGDVSRRLRLYREAIEFNPRRLDEVEERLAVLRSLQRKYGASLEAVLAHAEKARQELEAIAHADERIQALQARETELLAALGAAGSKLSESRKKAGERLAKGIEAELNDLRMAGARFGVDLRWDEAPEGAVVGEQRVAFSASGLDHIEFLIAPNPGEGLKPLARTASGGETSRLMLGLKGVLAKADRTPTLIFDEIDQGIGGRVGAVVGEKLHGLAQAHQVLCVTHLPQLAAYGDQHLRVEKDTQRGRTQTHVRAVAGDERIAELALMLGGDSQANRRSAAELLEAARVATHPS